MRWVVAFLFCLSMFGESLLDTLPMRFEPNPGLNPANSQVKWSARGSGYAFLFTDDATVLRAGGRIVKLTFPGANREAKFSGAQRMSTRINYFTGRRHASVRAFKQLRRTGIYPGVDLVYYGNGREIEYDFEIAPGADTSQIRMRFDGADAVRICDTGSIALTLGSGQIEQRKPVVYQKRASGEIVAVESNYVIDDDGSVRIELGAFDSSAKLIVDPAITYSAYLQGSSVDTVVGVGHDAQGNIYMAGNTYSIDFPVTPNGDILALAGVQNVWVAQINPALGSSALTYCSYLGGEAVDTVKAMTVDSNGVMYIAGSTDSGTYPVSANAYNSTYSGNIHPFLTMIDPSQQGAAGLIYSTFFGGTTSNDEIDGIAVASGKIYVAGWTQCSDYPVLNAYQSLQTGDYNAFAAEFDPTQSGAASLIASTYLGGSRQDFGRTIAVDSQGLVYVSGVTYSFDFPISSNAQQPGFAGDGDVFLSVLNFGTATLPYSTYVGGSSIDEAKKMVITSSGKVALTGYTLSPDFPVTQNAYQAALGAGGCNAFLTVIDTSALPGQGLVYSTFFGGSVGEVAYDVKQDKAGRFVFGGYTLSPDLPVTPNALNGSSSAGNIDGFVAVIDPSLPPLNGQALVYSSYITGPGMQIVYGVDVDLGGTIYVAGITTGNVFPNAIPPNTYVLKTSVFVMLFTIP